MSAYRTGARSDDAPPPHHWGRALAALALFLVGTRIATPLPGLDADAVRAFMDETSGGTSHWWSTPFLPLLGASLGTLVFVRGLAALVTGTSDFDRRRKWRRYALVFYLFGAAAQGFSLAIYLESRTTSDLVPLVSAPGWGIRLAFMAVSVAAAGLTWRLANEISRAGVAHGPLALLTVASLPPLVERWYGLGAEVAHDLTAPLAALGAVLAEVLPTALLLVALARWRPESWGRPLVRGVAPKSALDLVLLPFLAGAQAAALVGIVEWGARSSWAMHAAFALNAHPAVAFAGGALCTALLARWLRAQPHAPRRVWSVVAVAFVAFAVGASALGMMVTARGVPRHVAAGLSLTRNWTELSLRGDGPHAAEDAPRLVERLRALHHHAEVVSASGDRIRLRVSPMEGEAPAAVASVLASGRLEFYCAAEDQVPVSPAGGEVAGLQERMVGSRPVQIVYEAATLEALAPVIARSEAVPGALTRAGCDEPYEPGARPRCYALRLDPSRSITNADLESTHVEFDTYDQSPYVSLRFSSAGAARFADLTGACVRRVLAIVLDGRIHSAPVVQQPITGGSARISLGTAGGPRRMLEEARALAATLRTGALVARWALDG